ncbi:MAG: hypothetical protein IJL64_07815 [Bacteroidales bacterium]|nr:hypothetical protein [Bacteroidales bacterium]
MKRLAVILLAACLCSACDDFFGGDSDPKPTIDPPADVLGYISIKSPDRADCLFKSAFEGGIKDPLSQANYCWQLYDQEFLPGQVDYKQVKVLIDSWRCREDGGALHNYNHLCRIAIRNVPDFGSIDLPLEQTADGMYISSNKALLSLTVNKYSFDFIEDEKHNLSHYELHVDINVKLSRSDGGDIHIVYDGAALPDGLVWPLEK